MKHLIHVFIATLIVSTTGLAHASQPTPEERAYKFRTSLFQTFAWKLGRMAGAKGQNDEAAFIGHAKDLVYLSGLIEEGFAIKDSMPEGSKAKAEIWQDYAEFQDKASNMTKLATDLTQTGAMDSFNPRDFGSKACGSCHRDFKVKDDD